MTKTCMYRCEGSFSTESLTYTVGQVCEKHEDQKIDDNGDENDAIEG